MVLLRVQCAVEAMVVEVGHVLGQHSLEVAAVEDQHPVEQFAADGADPAFGDRVSPGCPHTARSPRSIAGSAPAEPPRLRWGWP